MVKAGEEEEVNNNNNYPLAAAAAAAPSSSSTFDEHRENSRPDLMRHVQAALKRHRPLGSMQPSSNVIRPRRILREPSRILKSNNKPTEKKKHHDDADCSSATPPSATETLSQEYMHNHAAASGDTQKKVQFSLAAENAVLSHRADERLATGIALLSSHLASLSFTDDATNVVQIPSTCGPDNLPQQMEVADMSDGGVSSLLAKRSMLMQNSGLGKEISQPMMNQSSVAGSSCMTTISVHSKSAPALNSTTYNSQPRQNGTSHMDIELEDPDVNPRPMSQGFPSQLSHPTYRCTSGMLADSSVAPTQMSMSSLPTTLGTADQGPPKEQRGFAANTSDRSVEGRIDQAKGSSVLDDRLSKEKGNHADVIDLQSHAPMTKSTCTSVNVESSKSDKPDKSATHKETSGPRKKNYDPDIFVKVNGKLYQKLGKIGSGGSSEVYKVITSDCTIYALKRIKLKGRDYSTAYGFCQEIEYLKKLKGKNNIIQLIDYEVTDRTLLEEVTSGAMNVKDSRIREDGYIYMVLEYGEIDLAHMLSHKWKEQDSANWTMDENWLRFYWQEILQAVNTIHEERIVHSDLKPANFLFVKGSLKLIDFGIAKAIMSDTTNIQRDSQVGTLSYMSPEAFMCNENDSQGNAIKCGRPSDIWSLGCILYQMVYGRTPFAEYKTFWAKFKVITDRNHEIKYGPVSNPWLLDLMKKCLAWERKDRWRIPELLRHPFLVPPITPSLHGSNQGLDLLEQISESHRNDDETFRLCSQLQALLRGSGNTNESSQLSMVSQMLNLWSQLQQRLTSIQN